MEKNMEHETETGVIYGFKEPSLSYYIGQTIFFLLYVPIMVT